MYASNLAGRIAALLLMLGCLGFIACSNDVIAPDPPSALISTTEDPTLGFLRVAPDRPVESRMSTVPPGLVEISVGSESLSLWPWTGSDVEGSREDPVNVIFVGRAEPARIRAALLALDGDRSALGFPNSYPFNATWSDAMGNVQATWTEDEGWTGSVIQLQLGQYEPMRFHLRLFSTRHGFGSEGVWTVAAVHMDLKIPNTADHVPISWIRPREILIADMMRSGLLDPVTPTTLVGPITDLPSYRTIAAVIYNGLPPDLKAYIGGPAGTVTEDVPIPNDGMAMVLHLAQSVPVEPGRWSDNVTMVYNQVIPKPLCSEGPWDYVLVRGPVDMMRVTTVDRAGRYSYHYRYQGMLTIVPMDMTVSPPVPSGLPYQAEVSGFQNGMLHPDWFSVDARDQRIAEAEGGTQLMSTRLVVRSRGITDHRVELTCPNLVF